MTTIAVSRLEMACDSRTSWDTGFYTCNDKVERIDGNLVGCSGNVEAIFRWLAWYKGETKERPEFDAGECDIAVLNENGIFAYHSSTYPTRVCEPYYAVGSGGMAALAAMICGKTPAEAVRVAFKCDKNSGGPVRSFSLKRKS